MKTMREMYGVGGPAVATAAGDQMGGDSARGRSGTIWHVLVEQLRTRAQVRAAVRELQRLDDRVLADLGVLRCDIKTVVEGAARAKVSRAF
mgnify:FL=1